MQLLSLQHRTVRREGGPAGEPGLLQERDITLHAGPFSVEYSSDMVRGLRIRVTLGSAAKEGSR